MTYSGPSAAGEFSPAGGFNPFVLGVRCYAYSHSYTISLRVGRHSGSGASSPLSLYVNRVCAEMGMIPVLRASGGADISEIQASMFGGNSKTFGPWYPEHDWGIVVLDLIRNMVHYFGTDTAAQTMFAHALRSMLRLLRCGPSDGIGGGVTRFGTPTNWTRSTGYFGARGLYGGDMIYTADETDSNAFPINFTGPELFIWSPRFRTGSTATDGTWQIEAPPGTIIATWNGSDGFPGNPTGSVHSEWYLHTSYLTGFGAGPHTVWIRRQPQGNTLRAYLNCWGTPTIVVPRVFLIQDGDESAATPTMYPGAPGTKAQAYQQYRDLQHTIANEAEFASYVTEVTLPDWDPETMTDANTPFVHPNDSGHACLARNLRAAINGKIDTWIPGVHVI